MGHAEIVGKTVKRRDNFKQGFFKPANTDKYRGKLPIFFRSSWELAFCSFCDKHSGVLQWGIESVVVDYIDETPLLETPKGAPRSRRYFVDFFMTIAKAGGGKETLLVEIKPWHETVPPKPRPRQNPDAWHRERCKWMRNLAKWRAATEAAKRRGWRFQIMTERQLALPRKRK